MRRRVRDDEQVPPRLAEFSAGEWTGRSLEERVAAWREARHRWLEEYGWPGGPLAMLRGESDVRRRLAGVPLLPWGRTDAELTALDGRPRSRFHRDVPQIGGGW